MSKKRWTYLVVLLLVGLLTIRESVWLTAILNIVAILLIDLGFYFLGYDED